MKLNTKTIVAIAVVLFLLLWGGHFLFRRPAHVPSGQAMNPYGAFGPPGGAMPDMNKMLGDQAKLVELMNNYHIGFKAANYIAQAKLQVLEQTDTSIHFVLSYPDKAKIDETVSLAADPDYIPSAADLERAARVGFRVHGPKLTVKKNGQKEWQCTLQYHVPYSAVPRDLLQKIQPAASRQNHSARFFDLVPTVRADGGLAAGELSIAVIANYFAEAYKSVDPEIADGVLDPESLEGIDNAMSLGVDVPLALADLGDDFLTLKNWLSEMDELEKCAKDPTNPLSEKASRDPNYQHDVLDPLSDARDDVRLTWVPMLASDTAGYLSHFLPFGSGAAVGMIFGTQDEAVNQIAENRIQEAQKYVVPCDDAPMTPGDLRPMEGVLKYSYISKPPHELPGLQDTRKAEGKFELNVVGGGGLKGEGTADYSHEVDATALEGPCKGKTGYTKAGGKVKIIAGGGGTPLSGVIELRLEGELPVEEHREVSEEFQCKEEVVKNDTATYGAVCRFQRVDMVHGGTFSTFAEGSEGYGTCTIELSRK